MYGARRVVYGARGSLRGAKEPQEIHILVIIFCGLMILLGGAVTGSTITVWSYTSEDLEMSGTFVGNDISGTWEYYNGSGGVFTAGDGTWEASLN